MDGTNQVVRSFFSGTGKTQASFTLTPLASGTYTIRITGQAIGKTGATTNLYGSYQVSVAQAQAKLPTKSGDKNIDALVMGGTNAWFHEAGSVATKTNTQIKPGVTELQNVVGRPIKYAFMNSAFLSQLSGADANGAAVMTNTQKQAVQDAFGYFSSVINQSFELVADPTQADIVFGTNNQGGTSAGYAYLPNMSGNHAQYLMLANDQATNSTFTNGSYGLLTLLHEMGHTLGLKHPGNYNAGGGGTPGPYLSKADDNRRNTIMSYYGASGISANPQTLMAYDIAALQYLYGANRNPTNMEALAKRQTTTFTDGWAGLESLWTPQGATIDLSAMTKSNVVDLRQGAFSSIGTTKNNVSLAYGSRIDAVTGGKGADQVYTAATGNMVLSGGEGADTLYLAGTAKEWTQSGSTWTRKQAGKTVATVTATQFETVAFYDPAKTALMRA
jgi:serralysin